MPNLKTRIEFEFPSEELARNIAFALEVNKKINRGKLVITSTGKKLVLDFEAEDETALRAALNTHLRLVDMILNAWEVVENGRSKRC